MNTKSDASLIRQKFWTSFGKYMSPVPSATLEKVNWVNYKTGIKGISFKMEADKDSASIAVEIFLKDTMLQHQYFEIFNNFTKHFENIVGKGWCLKRNNLSENKENVSKIVIDLKNVSIFRDNDWPTIISFLKHSMIGLDAFWAVYKPAFELI